LYEKFGSWELALAAYDMGYKGMLERVKDTGSNDYWTLAKIDGALPREAALYVPKILAVAVLLNNLEHYGFDDTHVDPPLSVANLEVPAGLDLATIARAAGTSVQRIHELNPELLGSAIPDRGRSFFAHVPAGGLARAHAILPRLLDRRDRDELELRVGQNFDWGKDEIPRAGSRRDDDEPLDLFRAGRRTAQPRPADPEGTHTVFYRVGERETLDDVARMFGVSPGDVADENYLDPGAKLQKGMLLSLTVRADQMSRIEKKRAAARLERQEAEEEAKRDEGEVMHGYALASPRSPDSARTSTLGGAPTQKPNTPVPSDAPKPHGVSAHGGPKSRFGGDAVRRDGKQM
jgi:membrane-bound lytic murein transglycosylase D